MRYHSKLYHSRENGIETIACTVKEFADIQMYLRENEIPFLMPERGASMFVPRWKQSFQLEKNLKIWKPSFSDLTYITTPAKAARMTLAAYCAPYSTEAKFLLNAPIAWKPTEKHVHYIDIKSAYYQVYRRLTLTAKPKTNSTIDFGDGDSLQPVADELADWKLARNAVPGLLHGGNTLVVRNRHIKRVRIKSKYLNPAIWFLCNAVMHEIASIALKCGLHYAHTDGYFVDNPAELLDFLDQYGIEYVHQYGYLSLTGWQSYLFRHQTEGREETKKTKCYQPPRNSTRILFGVDGKQYNQAPLLHARPFLKIKRDKYHYTQSIFGR